MDDIEEAKQLDLSKSWNEIASAVMNLKKRWKHEGGIIAMMQNQINQEYIKFTDVMEAKERHITKVNIYGSS